MFRVRVNFISDYHLSLLPFTEMAVLFLDLLFWSIEFSCACLRQHCLTSICFLKLGFPIWSKLWSNNSMELWKTFSVFILLFLNIFGLVCICVDMSPGTRGVQESWMLGIKWQSSVREAHTLNYQGILQTPNQEFFIFTYFFVSVTMCACLCTWRYRFVCT